jgi:hypothetical protein
MGRKCRHALRAGFTYRNAEDLDANAAIDRHVRTWLTGMRELLDELPPNLLSELQSVGDGGLAERTIRQAVGVARKLKGRVSKATLDEIVLEVASRPDEPSSVTYAALFIEAVEFCEEHFKTAADASINQLQALVEATSKSMGTSANSVTPAFDVHVEHNWVDAQGGKVPLVFRPTTNQSVRPYGYVSAPLVLVAKQRRACTFKREFADSYASRNQGAWAAPCASSQPPN